MFGPLLMPEITRSGLSGSTTLRASEHGIGRGAVRREDVIPEVLDPKRFVEGYRMGDTGPLRLGRDDPYVIGLGKVFSQGLQSFGSQRHRHSIEGSARSVTKQKQIGATGFEPAATSTPYWCANQAALRPDLVW